MTKLNQSFDYTPAANGVFIPDIPVNHRDEEYDQSGFAALWDMQIRHFWYRGRHRFLLHATNRAIRDLCVSGHHLSTVDLGGGCGGWVKYLTDHKPVVIDEIALADSSLLALEKAGTILPPGVSRYQVDLLRLGWRERWDAVYLLDVLEHLPDDKSAMRQVAAALKPGGLVFVTMPALKCFWSYNDEVAHHCRRYDRNDLARLAEDCGLRLLTARYFMFFLSPLLWISRFKPGIEKLTPEQKLELAARSHRVPIAPVNEALAAIFFAETPLGHYVHFPWGTSVFGLFQKLH